MKILIFLTMFFSYCVFSASSCKVAMTGPFFNSISGVLEEAQYDNIMRTLESINYKNVWNSTLPPYFASRARFTDIVKDRQYRAYVYKRDSGQIAEIQLNVPRAMSREELSTYVQGLDAHFFKHALPICD